MKLLGWPLNAQKGKKNFWMEKQNCQTLLNIDREGYNEKNFSYLFLGTFLVYIVRQKINLHRDMTKFFLPFYFDLKRSLFWVFLNSLDYLVSKIDCGPSEDNLKEFLML